LNEARDLVTRLDFQETCFPRSLRENQLVLERTRKEQVFADPPSEVPPVTDDRSLVA